MAHKRFRIVKHTGFYTDKTGVEKKQYQNIGKGMIYSKDGELPADAKVVLELPAHMFPGLDNPVVCFNEE